MMMRGLTSALLFALAATIALHKQATLQHALQAHTAAPRAAWFCLTVHIALLVHTVTALACMPLLDCVLLASIAVRAHAPPRQSTILTASLARVGRASLAITAPLVPLHRCHALQAPIRRIPPPLPVRPVRQSTTALKAPQTTKYTNAPLDTFALKALVRPRPWSTGVPRALSRA